MTNSPSQRLAEFIAGFDAAALPHTTLYAAKRVLLDATGVMIGASGAAPETEPFVSLARLSGEGPSRILGTDMRVPAPAAAFANGAFAHALDFEDAFDLVPGHPNASLVPALLALAQSEGPVDGRQFLASLAIGCDTACRMALALTRRMEEGGWYPPPILGGFGAVAGAARLLGLNADRVRDALSLMLCQVTMPGEIKYSAGTQIRAVREAFPAQAAVQSVLLARDGVRGFEQPLEGRAGFYALYAAGHFDKNTIFDALGERFWIEHLTFKPWPSCRGTHPFIQMALELRQRHGFALEDLVKVTVGIDAIQQMLVEPRQSKCAPSSPIEAKFSIQFATALALARGHVTLDDFTADDLADQHVLRLAAQIEVEVVGQPDWHPGSGGRLAVRLKNGDQFETQVENARGCPAMPMSDADLRDKFITCAAKAAIPLDREAASALADAVMSIEDCEDVGVLFA
jgi:2-methylcitrate dehydratase PrpD